jgi:hypothetical protein
MREIRLSGSTSGGVETAHGRTIKARQIPKGAETVYDLPKPPRHPPTLLE